MAFKQPFPLVSEALIEALEKQFPDVCPNPLLTHEEVRVRMGEVAVVRFLRRHHDSQHKTILIGA